ncbi:MAG: WbqC family protein [Chitinispirillaceae bacterium]|nr:WbqC family protein [Chitinispirillaceae bacterium]
MKKTATAHQPNYLPWIGLFSKIKQSDCFVIADIFEMGNHSVFNKNKVRTNDGWLYLTVPVSHRMESRQISDVMLPADNNWKTQHWQTIYRNYAKTRYFKQYGDFFNDLYKKEFTYLWEVNIEIIRYLMRCFNIEVEILKASEMDVGQKPSATDSIIAFMKKAGADTYLSGPSGKNYLETQKFESSDISLKYFSFEHPVYRQRYEGFEYNMSAIDLLFNTGPEAENIITASGSIE